MYFGTFSMCIHACVSVIRCSNICHPEKVEWFEMKYVYFLVVISILYSGGWAFGPLLEWGRYETYEFGCTIVYSSPAGNGRIYVTLAFLCVLLFPLGILITCYMLIVVQAFRFQKELSHFTTIERKPLSQRLSSTRSSHLMESLRRRSGRSESGSTRKQTEGKDNEEGDKNKEAEKREEDEKVGDKSNEREGSITSDFIFDKGSVRRTQRSLRLQAKLIRMSMVVAGGYILAWMPYATVCIWVSYGNVSLMPEGLRIGASLFCKSATAYNPFIYYFMSESFRQDVRRVCSRKRRIMKLEPTPPLHTSLSPQPASFRSIEGSIRTRSIRGDSFHQRVPSIRRTSTSTLGSQSSDDSPESSIREHNSPTIDISSSVRISPSSPTPERKQVHRLVSPTSPVHIHRMRSLPHSASASNRTPTYVRRLSSTPFPEESSQSRRSSFNLTNDVAVAVPSTSRANLHSRTGLAGRISSSSLRLPPTYSPTLNRQRNKALSQSFRVASSSRVTVHRRESWMGPRTQSYEPKSTRQIQRDLENIITKEFHGDLKLDETAFDREEKMKLIRRKSLRSNAGSPNFGDMTAYPSRPRQRLSFHGSGRMPTEKRETPNFLEIPKITKTNWDQDRGGPVRSRSLHGRPSDYNYKSDIPRRCHYSEY